MKEIKLPSKEIKNLSRPSKEAYIKAIRSGEMKPPFHIYDSIIMVDSNGKTVKYGDPIADIHKYMPPSEGTIIILPLNGREIK